MRGRRRTRDQRGVIAIEFMLIISMLMVVFLLMLQYAVRAHAEHIASAAAREGLAAATAYDGSAAEGRLTTRSYLSRLGRGMQAASVTVNRGPTVAAVTVSGEAEQFIPFLTVRIHVRVQGPVERFVTEP